MSIPKLQEPDWSTLPKEAVAWAVDRNGEAFIYSKTPTPRFEDRWDSGGRVIRFVSCVDLTNIDWRTTLRLRPAVEPVDHRPEIQALTESVEGLKAEDRNYELERLAEEAWKRILADCGSYHDVAVAAFNAAEHFIAEREKRRNLCP